MSTDHRAQFVEDVSVFMSGMGIPRMPSRVFSLLLSSDEETLTAAELAERLEVSPAAISGAVRQLTQLRMVRRSRRPGERKDRFGIAPHVWEDMMSMESTAYSPLITMCDQALEQVDFGEASRRRIEDTRDFMAFLLEQMPLLMDKWRSQRGR